MGLGHSLLAIVLAMVLLRLRKCLGILLPNKELLLLFTIVTAQNIYYARSIIY